MINHDEVDQVIGRITTVDWQLEPQKAESHLHLTLEYFRRTALWANALECTNEWPFFDVAKHVSPSERVSLEQVERIRRHLEQFAIGFLLRGILEWSLHWAKVKNTTVAKLGFPDPYEPMLIVYERGGTIYPEHGHQIDISRRKGFLKRTWDYYIEKPSYVLLDKTILDELDEGENRNYDFI